MHHAPRNAPRAESAHSGPINPRRHPPRAGPHRPNQLRRTFSHLPTDGPLSPSWLPSPALPRHRQRRVTALWAPTLAVTGQGGAPPVLLQSPKLRGGRITLPRRDSSAQARGDPQSLPHQSPTPTRTNPHGNYIRTTNLLQPLPYPQVSPRKPSHQHPNTHLHPPRPRPCYPLSRPVASLRVPSQSHPLQPCHSLAPPTCGSRPSASHSAPAPLFLRSTSVARDTLRPTFAP